MEDQGKRLLLAVAIAFALLWAWNIFFPTPPPEKTPEADEQAEPANGANSGTVRDGAGDTGGSTGNDGSGEPAEPALEAPRGEEEIVRFEFSRFAAEFSTYGGALRSWQLTEEQFEDRRGSPAVPLELVPSGERGSDAYSMLVSLGEQTNLSAMRTAEWKITERGDRNVTFQWKGSDYEVTKKYELDPELFLLELQVDVVPKRTTEVKHEMAISMFGFQDPKEAVGGGMTRLPREWKAACLIGEELREKSAKDMVKEPWRRDGEIRWGGFAHSYFLVGVAPELRDGQIKCGSKATLGPVGGMELTLRFPPVVVSDAPYSRRLVSYMGPKFVGTLEQASIKSGFDAGFEEAVDLGFLGFLSGPLLWLLTIFQTFVINWGLAIIALTVVIKLVLLPLTHKSIKSMKGMSKLRPQMEALKEKYPDDKQKLQVETMNLFKTNGVNPAAGCLPMILQMPIWFALYRMLMAAAELYQAPFIPGWLDDLTAPDPYYILPVSVTILMFFQTKLTPTTATGMQMKVMMYGMPLMFGFFSLFFPAGLTLYIFTNTALTLVHYYFVHKEDRVAARIAKAAKAAKVAAGEDPDESDDDDNDGNNDNDDNDDDDSADAKPATPGSKGESNVQKRARKGGKGSRGGKKNSKKKKKKNRGVGV